MVVEDWLVLRVVVVEFLRHVAVQQEIVGDEGLHERLGLTVLRECSRLA